MKREIINFYKDKDIPISLMIDKRRHNTTPEQVEEAAVQAYEEIQDGFKIKDREIPRYIFRKAVGLKGDQYKKERLLIQNYDQKVRVLAKAYKKNKHELDKIKSTIEIQELKKTKIFLYSLWGVLMGYSILQIIGSLL
jgi:hypothetical protein